MRSSSGCLVLLLVSLAVTYGRAQETRVDPKPARQGRQKGTTADPATCGTLDDLSRRVEVCARPLMDMLTGQIEKWPRTDDDAQALCNSFGGAERCIRDASRKCARGIHKTIISTLANSIQRVRKRECSPRTKLAGIVKLTNCVEKNQNTVQNWMKNVTGRLTTIELQMEDADKRLMSLCCMITDIEKEINQILGPLCPTEAKLIVKMYRSVLEDVLDLICRAPKCNDYLRGYKIRPAPEFSGIISILLRIVFSLDI